MVRPERSRRSPEVSLLAIYQLLYERYGPQHWWPAETPLEMIIGAILTQSAAWTNVEKAIAQPEGQMDLSPSSGCGACPKMNWPG